MGSRDTSHIFGIFATKSIKHNSTDEIKGPDRAVARDILLRSWKSSRKQLGIEEIAASCTGPTSRRRRGVGPVGPFVAGILQKE